MLAGGTLSALPELRIYNTLGGKVVPFRPLSPPRVRMFVCGITPQKPAHIGHARTTVFFDVVARFLDYLGYHVFYLQNVTDVDDKILRVATEEGVDWKVVAERNFADYLDAVDALGVRTINHYPRCTDYIPEIIAQIETLIRKGHAYESGDDVYFDVSSFPSYGALSGQRREEQEPGVRVEVNPKKRAQEDFALWKGERIGPTWESPWGRGRPGWHIEDTAITVNLLGPTYDIHGGAMELKFPHHEAEIAQAESATGQSPLARYWMHGGLLVMHGEKMSKSLGNVLPIKEALRLAGPGALRFYLLSAHYRGPLDYTGPEVFTEAARSYETLKNTYQRLREIATKREIEAVSQTRHWDPARHEGDKVLAAMEAAMCEDFNVRETVATLFTWSSEVNGTLATEGEGIPKEELVSMFRPFLFAQSVLGFFPPKEASLSNNHLVEVTLQARTRARDRGDYMEADRIRQELAEAGILVEDSAKGSTWRAKG